MVVSFGVSVCAHTLLTFFLCIVPTACVSSTADEKDLKSFHFVSCLGAVTLCIVLLYYVKTNFAVCGMLSG